MKFLERLFKKKPQERIESPKKEEKELDIKSLISEFIKSGVLNSLKSEKVLENAEFILNTLFESKMQNISQMKVMGLLFKIRKKIGMGKEAISDVQKLLNLFLKFMDEKGLITEEMKKEINKEGEMLPQATVKRESPKMGRNEPCRCGSRKKYKICCGK